MFWVLYEVELTTLSTNKVSYYSETPAVEDIVDDLFEAGEDYTIEKAQELASTGILRMRDLGSIWFLTRITEKDLAGILTSDLRWQTARTLGIMGIESLIGNQEGGLEA